MPQISFFPITFRNPSFKEMYRQYFSDLCQFDSTCSIQNFDSVYEKYIREEEYLYPYLIRIDQRTVGFIILQYVEEGCGITNPIWFIVEFYIEKEFRRKGYGFLAVQHFVKTRGPNFFLYILKKNEPAQKFWATCFDRLHLEVYDRHDVDGDEEVDTFYLRKSRIEI